MNRILLRLMLLMLTFTPAKWAASEEPRIWKSLDGGHSITARLDGLAVRLKRADGTTTSIEIDKLSHDDRKWLSDWLSKGLEPMPVLAAAKKDKELTHDEAMVLLRRAGITPNGSSNGGVIVSITPQNDDASVDVIRNLRFIKGLNEVLIATPKAEDYLAAIADVPGLQSISIDYDVSDKGLRHLSKHTQLKSLYIAGHRVTDAGLVHLEPLKQLETLKLTGTKVTKLGLEKLYKSLPKCVAELQ